MKSYATLPAGQDLFASVIPAIRNNLEGLGVERAPRLLGHVRKLASVVAYVGHLMGHDEMVLRIHGALNIITDNPTAPATRGHRACIGVCQRNLLVLCLHQLCVQRVQTLYLLAQRRNLLVEPRNLGLRRREPLAIRAIKVRQVAIDAFVDLLQAPPAKHHELTADVADRLAVVLAKIGYRFEIRRQAASQPDELDVALALPLKAA